MRTLLKGIAVLIGLVFAFVVLASIYVALFFDANSYKPQIEEAVRDATGREFAIEGDLSLSLFPWLALDTGRMTLGNAEGFGDEPFFELDSASFSMRLWPALTRDELSIGKASIEGLAVNLGVDETGRANWDDLVERFDAAEQAEEAAPPADGQGATASLELSVERIAVIDAAFSYRDAQEGTAVNVDAINLETGRIAEGEPLPLSASFAFAAEPDDIAGTVDMRVTADTADDDVVRLDGLELLARIEGATAAPADIRFAAPVVTVGTGNETLSLGSIEFSIFDLDLAADVEPFSYAGSIEPSATFSIAAFSPRSLLTTLGAELPATADPAALEYLQLDAAAAVTASSISLSDIVLKLDDTTLSGQLVVPREPGGSFELDLAGDTIDLNRYLAPPEENEAAAAEGAPPAEIPSELLRPINARGSLVFGEVLLGKILFEDINVVLNQKDGRLRLNPMSSKLFGGQYQGDVQLDVSGATPVISVNERIENVGLGPLGQAMLDNDRLSGRIDGVFTLNGTGNDTAEMQKTLNGNVSFQLRDGTYEGTDVWHELRRARAVIRREPPPEPTLPARTRFTEVSATGRVVNGVLNNDDLVAELPFIRLAGRGSVDLVAATLDYTLNGRVFEKPELMGDVTPEELEDFTKVELPIRISGELAEPKFGLDFEELVKEKAEEAVKDKLLDLLGDDEPAEGEAGAEDAEADPEEILKDKLRDLLKRD